MLYSCPKMLFNLAQYPCTVGIFNHRSNINTISSINVINVEYIGNDILLQLPLLEQLILILILTTTRLYFTLFDLNPKI